MRGRQISGCFLGHLIVVCILAALSGSCSSNSVPTEVMLVMDADAKARMLGVELQVEIVGYGADMQLDGLPISRAFRPKEINAPTWPLSLSISPRGGDAQRSYQITATLMDSQGKIAVLRARSGFVAQKTIELRLSFSDDCLRAASLDCGNTETCLQGGCVDDFIDASALPPYQPGNLDGMSPAADGGIGNTSSSKLPAVMSGMADNGSAGSKSGSSSAKPGMQQGAGGMSGSADAGMRPETDQPGDCGDGRINPGEKCDTGIAEGPGACPTACASQDKCKPETLEGSGCQTACVAYPISTAESGDGCCPPGTDAKDDTDCGAVCGNGVIEAGEKCDPPSSCPTLDSCQKADPCLRATVVGDAAACSAECMMEKITECISGDGCCGSGDCNHSNDTDCSASCGDGVVDVRAGELCEPMSPNLPCPTTCTDSDPCTSEFLTGSEKNCNSACVHVPILVSIPADGCCPPGGNANSDFDCKAMCGNGIVELGERCDGRCPTKADCDDGNACTRDDIEGVAAMCNVRCTHTLINVAANGDSCCPQGANANNDSDCVPMCGNGVKEKGEICDGNDCPRCMDTDNDPCTRVRRGGTNCNPTCTPETITTAANGDGCCPAGVPAGSDSDCKGPPPATCPNGKMDPGETCDPCPAACDDNNSCTTDTGSPDQCNCKHAPITMMVSGDGCCLDGGNSAMDSDCKNPPPAMCPNGNIDPGETCDPCPAACDDKEPCTKDTGNPTACNCVHTPITTMASGDGCCLMGGNSESDSDCKNPPPPTCPNNHVDPGETCDPCPMGCDDHDSCTTDTGSPDKCNCAHAPKPAGPMDSCCPAGAGPTTDKDCPGCGNGKLDPGEECDDGPRDTGTCKACMKVMPMGGAAGGGP